MAEMISFNITQIMYPKIYFEIDPEMDPFSIPLEIDANCGFGLKGQIQQKEMHEASCSLDMLVIFKYTLEGQEEKEFAKLNIKASCLFTAGQEFTGEMLRTLQPNFYAILFPFLRETVYSVSSRSGIQLMIPPVNFIESIKNNPNHFTLELK